MVRRSQDGIVGGDVREQDDLRPPVRVHDLDEFLEFLERCTELSGSIDRPRSLATGPHFLL